jgi:demethylmenaquinone methyltransferase/2-methoxy-6-polyprenyl-1,4-benzoquinol methylase
MAPAGHLDPNRFARRLFARLPARYDRLAEVLSMGQNARWRRAMVDHVVAGNSTLILDVASGTAGVALQLAERSEAHVVGVDLSLDMLGEGAQNVRRRDPRQRVLGLVGGRAEQLPFPDGAFDGMTFTYLLRYVADVEATMAELARVLRPGSAMASLDFMVPPRRFWRAWWWGYTRLVLPVAGAATGGAAWFRVGRFLGPNISAHYRRHPVADIVAAWERAGMVEVGHRTMSLGGGLIMWGRRADA